MATDNPPSYTEERQPLEEYEDWLLGNTERVYPTPLIKHFARSLAVRRAIERRQPLDVEHVKFVRQGLEVTMRAVEDRPEGSRPQEFRVLLTGEIGIQGRVRRHVSYCKVLVQLWRIGVLAALDSNVFDRCRCGTKIEEQG